MRIFLIVLLACFSVEGQNLLVKFYPANQPYVGLTNWPLGVLPTNNASIPAGWATNMTLSDYSAYVAAQQPVYDAGVSNALVAAQAQIAQDIADLQTRLADNNSDRLNMQTNTLTLNQLNNVVTRILKTLKKVDKLLIDQYGKNQGQDASQ